VLISACSLGGQAQATDWSRQTTASGGGGLSELIKAARREGALVLPARPYGSAGWAANLDGFQQRYGIQVSLLSADDDASQVAEARRLDVLDLSPDVAEGNTAVLAPYVVFYWSEIPAALKNARAFWYADCGGFASIGYDSNHVAPVTSVQQLLTRGYKSAVSLVGDPTADEGALAAVVMASIAAGGTADDVAPGVDFFGRLRAAGNLGAWGGAGAPPVVIGWDYYQAGLFPDLAGWTHFVPPEASVAAYRAQAVSRYAAHPAAARLWEEYLFSDAGQNACLRLGARPARLDAMRDEGTLDQGAAAALDPVGSRPVVLTARELADARAYVAAHWAAALAGQ
jgi:putative spermidine/putrescine transport system substrate-binding protein